MLHERVDDIPLLIAEMRRMGLVDLLNDHFVPHGNWGGLPLGEVAVLWMSHILSEGNHRLCHVEPWAQQRLTTLSSAVGTSVRALDLADDRLAAVLRYLGDDRAWQAFESELNRHSIRVYALELEQVRLDSSTASSYRAATEGGLFQLGYSKGAHPELPILKIMAATLDPLSLPLVTTVLPGHHADDPLYVPAVEQVRTALGREGLLYVGDCKMGAAGTRAFVAAGGDFYLCPLSEKQVTPDALAALLAPVWAGEQATTLVEREEADGGRQVLASAFEVRVMVTGNVAGKEHTWEERQLVVRSLGWAQSRVTALRGRVRKAVAAVTALGERARGKQRPGDRAGWEEAVQKILQRYEVAGLVEVTFTETEQERTIRRRGANPTRVVVEREITVSVRENSEAVREAERRLGWRVYATNAPVERLSLTQAVLCYRSQYLIERSFGRLKGRPLSLEPMYLLRDDHATGLVRLLSLALRVLSVVEFQVRRGLAEAGAQLAGLYPGNPGRRTARPSTELLLQAFAPITLTLIDPGGEGGRTRHLTTLSPIQERVLELLRLPVSIYTSLTCS
jgi:transposase